MNLKEHLMRFLTLFFVMLIYSSATIFAQIPFIVSQIISEASGDQGITVKIIHPPAERFPTVFRWSFMLNAV